MSNRFTSIIASCTGSFVEWYDYVLFIYLAPVINHVFFHTMDSYRGLLYVMLVFAASSLARPFGALLFGHLGDRHGRAKTLQLILLLMSCISLAMALIPSSQQIGHAAPITLLILRILQGLCVGGEFSGSIVYLGESTQDHQRGFITSMINTGSNLGIIVAISIVTIVSNNMPEPYFYDVGWRIAYILGAALGFVGLTVRFRLKESPVFEQMAKHISLEKFPIKAVFQQQLKPLIIISAQFILSAAGSYVLTMFLSTYLHYTLHMPLHRALLIQTIIVMITLFLIPLFGLVGDRVGRRSMLSSTCIAYVALSIPCFYLMVHTQHWAWILPLIVFYCVEQSTTPATVVENYPEQNRFTGISISYNLVMAIVGGFTPFLLTLILHKTHDNLIPAYYLMAFGLLVLINVIFGLRKYTSHPS